MVFVSIAALTVHITFLTCLKDPIVRPYMLNGIFRNSQKVPLHPSLPHFISQHYIPHQKLQILRDLKLWEEALTGAYSGFGK